jgi:hypothetical protein
MRRIWVVLVGIGLGALGLWAEAQAQSPFTPGVSMADAPPLVVGRAFAAPGTARSFSAPRPERVGLRATMPADTAQAPAPQSEASPHRIRWGRVALVGGGLAAGATGLHLYERAAWWSGARIPFHFSSQLDYAYNFDKAAHFFAADVEALIVARSLEWTGLKPEHAALYGVGVSLLIQTHTEIFDGFHARWGFDWYDQAANVLGAGWFYAHERVPFLRHFDVRWAYFPPQVFSSEVEPGRKQGDLFTSDYGGHSYWLSVDVHGLLPQNLKPYWPRFLALSVGASLNDWQPPATADDPYRDPDAYVSYHLSVDLDFRKILPRSTWLGRTFGDLLSRYHLPFPAIEVYPRPGVSLVFLNQ